MSATFLARPDQLEEKIAEWQSVAAERLRIEHVTSYSGHKVYALTVSDFGRDTAQKTAQYFAQPHAHEPATTAGMIDILNQLLTGRDLAGNPSSLDIEAVLAGTVLTFNPIGNPQGRDGAPVLYWDGSRYTMEELACWMRGEDPANPGKMWQRFDVWDDREVKAPSPVGIVYEQIDEHRYVEPNRTLLSSYSKLFHKMDEQYAYQYWLSLHQAGFRNREHNCEILLPLEGLTSGVIKAENEAWGQAIVDAWTAAGLKPHPTPHPSGYTGTQAEYFRRTYGPLHKRMDLVTVEGKTNAPEATPDFQMRTQTIAITTSIERVLARQP